MCLPIAAFPIPLQIQTGGKLIALVSGSTPDTRLAI